MIGGIVWNEVQLIVFVDWFYCFVACWRFGRFKKEKKWTFPKVLHRLFFIVFHFFFFLRQNHCFLSCNLNERKSHQWLHACRDVFIFKHTCVYCLWTGFNGIQRNWIWTFLFSFNFFLFFFSLSCVSSFTHTRTAYCCFQCF